MSVILKLFILAFHCNNLASYYMFVNKLNTFEIITCTCMAPAWGHLSPIHTGIGSRVQSGHRARIIPGMIFSLVSGCGILWYYDLHASLAP